MTELQCPHCGNAITEFWTLTATMPSDTRSLWDWVMEDVQQSGVELHKNHRVAVGQVVEILAASYFGSKQREYGIPNAERNIH